jgi:hypothetical protein
MAVSGLGRFAAWVLGLSAALPLGPAHAQNLDAGKPPSQIFSEVCANCHRSPREVRGNASTSFLREHYTTGGEMASAMAAYLSGAGGAAAAPQPKRQPAAPAATATRDPAAPTTRDNAPADASHDARRPQQPEPKGQPAAATAATNRGGHPGPNTTEAKLPNATPPAPTRPLLEDFEE